MDEMIEILERNFSPVEVVKILNDFRFNQQELDDYAIEHRICPKCYNELVIHSCYEPSEHFGFPVMEEMGKLRCEECGWIEN
jgi:uncharacterized protein with PIN domain